MQSEAFNRMTTTWMCKTFKQYHPKYHPYKFLHAWIFSKSPLMVLTDFQILKTAHFPGMKRLRLVYSVWSQRTSETLLAIMLTPAAAWATALNPSDRLSVIERPTTAVSADSLLMSSPVLLLSKKATSCLRTAEKIEARRLRTICWPGARREEGLRFSGWVEFTNLNMNLSCWTFSYILSRKFNTATVPSTYFLTFFWRKSISVLGLNISNVALAV